MRDCAHETAGKWQTLLYSPKPPHVRNKDENERGKNHTSKKKDTIKPLLTAQHQSISFAGQILPVLGTSCFYSVGTEEEICNWNYWVPSEFQELSWLAFSQYNCYFVSCWKCIFITAMQTRHVKLQRNQDFLADGGSQYLHFIIHGSRDWLCNEIITAWAKREKGLSNTCLWPVFVLSCAPDLSRVSKLGKKTPK